MNKVQRVHVEKRREYAVTADSLLAQFRDLLGIHRLLDVRVLYRYDVENVSGEIFRKARDTIFSEPPVDIIHGEEIRTGSKDQVFAVEYLPGQYDSRADSCEQCIRLLDPSTQPRVATATVYVLIGDITGEDLGRIKGYMINPVECRESSLNKPDTLARRYQVPGNVEILRGFRKLDESGRREFLSARNLAMHPEDLVFVQEYFCREGRDPTITEIRVLDTYWSDHCRHTTFHTCLDRVEFGDSPFLASCRSTYREYVSDRKDIHGESGPCITLMDLATMAVRRMKREGKLEDLEVSDEINACSLVVKAEVDGKEEEWLVLFKNETHNHPTEIEPYGGAATCLGGAIRDPLSGRGYVYQAMRITGSGDPRKPVDQTLPGKLPQIKITREAAHGYSSYGNQVGVATGLVQELYDEGFVAKRLEAGGVMAAVPRSQVRREAPREGDVILLVGGKTGRDGCGGATGSSRGHDIDSQATCGAEVQKGSPPIERMLQRLFRRSDACRLIKKCNDFGAGGVSVSIGELASGVDIDLDRIPKKYEGLDGTELAISESQERMAVVVDPEDADTFIRLAREENLEATPVARVSSKRRMTMTWRGDIIVDLSRDFLDTNGVRRHAEARVENPEEKGFFHRQVLQKDTVNLWKHSLATLDTCSRRGLSERFDSTVGARTVFLPYGGKHQLTPQEGMAAMIPAEGKISPTATIMTYGYHPAIGRWSPYHGACYAVLESIAKVTAMGGDPDRIRLSFQEYFERLERKDQWGKPLAALLGAYYAQKATGIPSVGGKDSMSGTFRDLHVPPTLISFAVCVARADEMISAEFKQPDREVVLIRIPVFEDHVPDFAAAMEQYREFRKYVTDGRILSASSVKSGGLAEAVSKMCFGNGIGFRVEGDLHRDDWFRPLFGCLIAETTGNTPFQVIGRTLSRPNVEAFGQVISLSDLTETWEHVLEEVFPVRAKEIKEVPEEKQFKKAVHVRTGEKANPRVFLPVFPGTNCEYDTREALERAGARCTAAVFRNRTAEDIRDSLKQYAAIIRSSQMVVIPGGFSAGDEPEGSGKFIATVFRNSMVAEEIMRLLQDRSGLMLGICNGFQALIKLGLLPHGRIADMTIESPTLTFNAIGRHVSRIVRTKVVSNLSPWLALVSPGEIYTVPVSHGEGRFVCNMGTYRQLVENGQIATQYVDAMGMPTYDPDFNPNGSYMAVESITSPDGRVMGKMGHAERNGILTCRNVPGNRDMKLFESGVGYFA